MNIVKLCANNILDFQEFQIKSKSKFHWNFSSKPTAISFLFVTRFFFMCVCMSGNNRKVHRIGEKIKCVFNKENIFMISFVMIYWRFYTNSSHKSNTIMTFHLIHRHNKLTLTFYLVDVLVAWLHHWIDWPLSGTALPHPNQSTNK